MAITSYYHVLGVAPDADFSALRKAYRARAMASHPDRHGGDAGKTDEFKRIVEAFNVLSDPLKRRAHDSQLGIATGSSGARSSDFSMGYSPEDEHAILDTMADDILEELIVGNHLHPHNTTLATLMLDLEKTEQFCLFREAKTHLYTGSTIAGESLFRQYVSSSPANILAHVFLARCCRANGKWRDAIKHLAMSIRIGETRTPPLQLYRLRRELAVLRKKQPGLLGILSRFFHAEPHPQNTLSPEEQEQRALNRAINRMAMERERRQRLLKE
ncbi:MAG: DnaJ domain-containing protein [Kiritimatiellia bacterium]